MFQALLLTLLLLVCHLLLSFLVFLATLLFLVFRVDQAHQAPRDDLVFHLYLVDHPHLRKIYFSISEHCVQGLFRKVFETRYCHGYIKLNYY